jgi:glycosyltransferase involved in cell wall biosynthesis
MHCRLFRQFNTTAYNFRWNLGNLLPEVKPLEKEFDFVNFAMAMIPKKGYPDVIQALAIVKEHYPNVRLNLVGGGSKENKKALHQLVTSLHLEDNVVFTPFFEQQEDLFQHLQKARFALLPCKIDSVSSTIRQAMHYGLPVVCYKTEGTPKLNRNKDCVLIAENSNVEDLANKMLMLMADKDLVSELRDNAKAYSARWSDDEKNSNQMANIFQAVIANYKDGTPVSEELLYKEEL